MKTITKILLVIGVTVLAGLFSLSFLSSQGFAGNNLANQQQSPSFSSSSYHMGGMMGGGYYGTSDWGVTGGHMMNYNYGSNFATYMWNMMSGAYGNFTSWCSHAMSRFFGS